MNTLVYLACPYSHPDPLVREARFREANRASAALMGRGLHIFSPISHTHPIALEGNLPGDWHYWRDYDTSVLRACRALVILQIDGWEASTGIKGEISIAESLHLPIRRVSPPEYECHLSIVSAEG